VLFGFVLILLMFGPVLWAPFWAGPAGGALRRRALAALGWRASPRRLAALLVQTFCC
jgi:hypothetical protein